MTNLFKTASFSHKGKRKNNEDSLFPNKDIPTTLQNLFLVCDGVGGHSRGEIASDLCCTQINSYFTKNKVEISDKKYIDDTILFVEHKFDSYIEENPEAMNMASTITLLHLHTQGATVAHMGDSRVYQFRNGKILFKTKDHTLVQALFDMGEITEEEMNAHPMKNRINKAMCGTVVSSQKADTELLTDLEQDDIFFLCSDGVIEAFTDAEMEKVFANTQEVDKIKTLLVEKCEEKSNDNYTGYIVKLTKEYIDTLGIEKKEKDNEKPYIETSKEEQKTNEATRLLGTKEKRKEKIQETPEKKQINIVDTLKAMSRKTLIAIIVAVGMIGYLLYQYI